MNIFKKKVINIISSIIGLFTVFTILLWIIWGDFLPPIFTAPNYNKVDRVLKTNIDELSYIAEALSQMNYNTIIIRKMPAREDEKNSMKVSSEYLIYETIPIPEELIGPIEALYKSGVEVISFGDGGYVNFSLWSNMDESRGIIYYNAGIKPNSEQLIEVSQLSKDNWYYYVHNYEKAKMRNPEKFK